MYKLLLHFIVFICLLGLTGCGKNFFKRADVKDVPVNVEERVQKNLEEGKGIRFGKLGKSGGTFDFASSNEMWRATVDTLDFVPLINASYSGGIIITDWFNSGEDTSDNKRDLKITVKFLSNDIRSDALDVDIHERICNAQNVSCKVNLIDSKISNDIKIAILKKAAFLEKNKVEKIIKENRKKRPRPVKSE
jgi:hypothetical protein